jgi:hypothetical protein
MPKLVSEILEVSGDAEVAIAHELNDRLQIVFFLSRDANLSILQLALDLKVLPFDRLDNLLGFVALQALRDFQFLAGMSDRRNLGFDLFDVAKINPALGKFANHDLAKAPQPRGVFRGQSDFIFVRQDFENDTFEIETRSQFFARLIQRVVDLLLVDFRDDVEGRHERTLRD